MYVWWPNNLVNSFKHFMSKKMLFLKVKTAADCRLTRRLFNFSKISCNFVRNMALWEKEKQNYLSMDPEEKHKLFKDYINWQDIPSWKKYAEENKLGKKIDLLPGEEIDASKNGFLADKISIIVGDITTLEVDAIVNAANATLLGGGGVDGAIHRTAGQSLQDECRTLQGCSVGEAKITGGYKLPAKYVIHTVGPKGEKPTFLQSCYKNSLKILLEKKLLTIAFPCISTGIYGYPLEPAAHVAVYTVRKHLEEHGGAIDRVIFCLFTHDDKRIYEGVLQSYFPIK